MLWLTASAIVSFDGQAPCRRVDNGCAAELGRAAIEMDARPEGAMVVPLISEYEGTRHWVPACGYMGAAGNMCRTKERMSFGPSNDRHTEPITCRRSARTRGAEVMAEVM